MADEAAVAALTRLLGQVNLQREVVVKLPNFAGRDTKPSTCKFAEWIYLYEQRVRDNDELSDQEKQRIVLQSLTGEARERYILLERSGTTFINIIAKFRGVYADTSTSIELIEAFHAAKQSSHESVTQFADRIELAALKITQHSDIKDKYYTSDAVLKAAFSKGLRDESLADRVIHLLDDEMRSFDDVRRKVITEDERRRRKVKPVKVIAEQQPSPELQDTRRRLKAAEEEISLLKKEREERQRADSQPKPNWPPRQRPKCEFCGMLGHIKPKCRAFLYQRELADKKDKPSGNV